MSFAPVLHLALFAQAKATPAAVAVVGDGRSLTYAELAERARRVSGALAAAGLEPGDRIGWLGKNDTRLVELIFAASLGSYVVMPLNWRLAWPEVQEVMQAGQVDLLLAERALVPEGCGMEQRHMWLDAASGPQWDDLVAASVRDESEGACDSDSVVVMLGTSGTTGLPKAVMLTHRNLLGLRDPAAPLPEWLVPEPGDAALIGLPMFHVAGISSVLDMLCTGAGASVILQREFIPARYADWLERDAATRLCLVPAMVAALLDNVAGESLRSPRLRHVIYGASPMTEALLDRALDAFSAALVQVYGLTETAGFVTALDPADHRSDDPDIRCSIGRPLPRVEVRVVDPSGTDVTPGATGELWIRSTAVMPGYFRKPEASAQALTADGWLRTGDAARIGPMGHIRLKDRIKNMIISGGENIYPAEIENALCACAGVADAAVIGVPDPRWGEAPCAFVVPRCPALDPEAVLAELAEKLARYKLPRDVILVESLPRNPSGKILHRVLREQMGATV